MSKSDEWEFSVLNAVELVAVSVYGKGVELKTLE